MTKAASPDQSLAAIELEDHGTPEEARPLAEPQEFRGLSYPLGRWAPKADELHDIAPGVRWLRMPLPFSLDHINLYVLEDGDGVALLDTGLNSDECISQWERLFAGALAGVKITRVIVTHYHPDHLGLAGWLCTRFDVPLWISRGEFLLAKTLVLDAQPNVPQEVVDFYARSGWSEQALNLLRERGWGNFAKAVAPLPVGFVRMKAGDVLRIGAHDWTCVPGSGHSPEHICLHQAELGLLIAGDQLLPRITSNVSVYPIEPEANPLQDWFDSLDLLATLPEDTLVLPSHNEPFRGVQARVQQLRDDHLGKLDRLLAHIKLAPRTAIECFEVLFKRKLTGNEYGMATGEALAHLHYLEKKSMLTRQARNAAVEYHPAG
jgi:glyoxylase-like metal-dependent hydrolase (beta-lactamase superfamily II)